MERKRIVLVTSSQPSLNPRMVKEADALAEGGYEVIVVGQFWNDWATRTDKELLPSKKWRFIRVGGSPEEGKYKYVISRLIHKTFRTLRAKLGLGLHIAELSIGRCSHQLFQQAVRLRADLYIGHNPGGLAPAILAAKKNNAKCGFDAEDFHRKEYSDDPNHPDVKCKVFLEEKYFPLADYITTSSPKISEEYKKIFPALSFNTILNVFPTVNDITVRESKPDASLKLFWFSQTIGPNRGLDEVIEAMRIIGSPNIELHALGNPRANAIAHYRSLASRYKFTPSQLHFYNPIPPDEIYGFASRFDIGLATEIGIPYNRTICLTNKIFTYIQSGLAVVASNTPAQAGLLNSFPGCGEVFETQNETSLAKILEHYLSNRGALNQAKHTSYSYGQEHLNWNTESEKFLRIISETLHPN